MNGRRLLLFDVDGTLLSSGPRGRRVFADALTEVFGTCGDVDGFRFEGKLDPAIVAELMEGAGIAPDVVRASLSRALTRYLDALEAAFTEGGPPTLKPGVAALLDALEAEPSAVRALLTGNVERGARLKLTAAGLWHRFAFGVWGDEGACREDLGPRALERARAVTRIEFTGKECVVIGDSRHDVACGLALGARVVAVATGQTSAADLAAAGAHVVLQDFSDLERAREAILA
ncbi:MAG TPA: HAD family hydrolase [Thermoanaerobaculia bacterium]|nr:HAD family hydrolase [Thermoanaerobaculia bacterium]